MEDNKGMIVAGKTNVASDSFWSAVLGTDVDITITDLGTDSYRILQVDQYTIIVENKEFGYLLVSKSAIIAVAAPDTVFPTLAKNMAEGVQKIQYKASAARTDKSKGKGKSYDKKPAYKPVFTGNPPVDHIDTTPKPPVSIIVKKAHSYERT